MPAKKKTSKPETTAEAVVRRLSLFLQTHFSQDFETQNWIVRQFMNVSEEEHSLRPDKQKQWRKFQEAEIRREGAEELKILHRRYADENLKDQHLLQVNIQSIFNKIRYFYETMAPRAGIPDVLTRWENLYKIHNISETKLIVTNMSDEIRDAYELLTKEFRYATSELNINTLMILAIHEEGSRQMSVKASIAKHFLLGEPAHDPHNAKEEELKFKTDIDALWKLRVILALDVSVIPLIRKYNLHEHEFFGELEMETRKHTLNDVDWLHHQYPYDFPQHRKRFSDLTPAVRALEKKWKKQALEKPMSSPRKRELEEWRVAREKALAEKTAE